MNSIGGEIGGSADGVVIGKLDVRLVNVPILLSAIHHNSEHLGVRTVCALEAAISRRRVGSCGDVVDAEKVVDGVEEL